MTQCCICKKETEVFTHPLGVLEPKSIRDPEKELKVLDFDFCAACWKTMEAPTLPISMGCTTKDENQ